MPAKSLRDAVTRGASAKRQAKVTDAHRAAAVANPTRTLSASQSETARLKETIALLEARQARGPSREEKGREKVSEYAQKLGSESRSVRRHRSLQELQDSLDRLKANPTNEYPEREARVPNRLLRWMEDPEKEPTADRIGVAANRAMKAGEALDAVSLATIELSLRKQYSPELDKSGKGKIWGATREAKASLRSDPGVALKSLEKYAPKSKIEETYRKLVESGRITEQMDPSDAVRIIGTVLKDQSALNASRTAASAIRSPLQTTAERIAAPNARDRKSSPNTSAMKRGLPGRPVVPLTESPNGPTPGETVGADWKPSATETQDQATLRHNQRWDRAVTEAEDERIEGLTKSVKFSPYDQGPATRGVKGSRYGIGANKAMVRQSLLAVDEMASRVRTDPSDSTARSQGVAALQRIHDMGLTLEEARAGLDRKTKAGKPYKTVPVNPVDIRGQGKPTTEIAEGPSRAPVGERYARTAALSTQQVVSVAQKLAEKISPGFSGGLTEAMALFDNYRKSLAPTRQTHAATGREVRKKFGYEQRIAALESLLAQLGKAAEMEPGMREARSLRELATIQATQ